MDCGIYRIVNLLDGKCYVGASHHLKRRKYFHNWAYIHKNNRYDKRLYQAMRQYGEENFRFEVLEYCSSDELMDKEQEWVEFYDSYKNGYNETKGGNSCSNFEGKKVYKIDPYNKKIIAEYESIGEAARKNGDFPTSIWRVCSGLANHSRNYFWCYVDEYNAEEIKNKALLEKGEKRRKPIKQIDAETGETIAVFSSVTKASKETGIGRSAISNNLCGLSSNAGGFIWRETGGSL